MKLAAPLLALAILAACSTNHGSLPAAVAPSLTNHETSWMTGDAKAGPLLYVSELNANDVAVFSYPTGKVAGTLSGFSAPHGLCVDKSGNVFVMSTGSAQIFEYAHGGTKPVQKLSDDGYAPSDCDVDPVNGDLAVADVNGGQSGGGGLSIFRKARGKPKLYFSNTGIFYYASLGYDPHGNLFVDGYTYGGSFALVELPAGSTTFTAITLNQFIRLPGGIRWNGDRLVLGDQYYISGPSIIYEFSISGNRGTKARTIALTDSCDVIQFWLVGKRIIAPDDCSAYVKYYRFPQGGRSTKSISDRNQPVSVTVSYPSQ